MYRYLVSFLLCGLLLGCSSPQAQKSSGLTQQPYIDAQKMIADDGYVLPITQYWPEKTTPKSIVVALHGFNDYSLAFDGMCNYLKLQDVACLAYDQRGFGKTEMRGIWPKEGRLQKDLVLMVSLLKSNNPGIPIYLVGESMGGAVIISSVSGASKSFLDNVEGLILLAPAVWARSTQPWYQEWLLWLSVHTFPGWSPTGDGLGVQATDNIPALRAMGQDENIIRATRIDAIYGLTNLMDEALEKSKFLPLKVLALYGEKDEVIPKKPTCLMLTSMFTAGVPLEFKHYAEGYHMLSRDLQAEQVFEDTYQWMMGDLKIQEQAVVNYCG